MGTPAPMAPPAPPPPGPYPPAGMPPPMAPPPGDRLPVALLAVVAVVVAIVVIAAVWWIFVASVFVPPAVRPQVSFSTPSLTQSGAATFSVVGASAAYPGVAYRANLEVDTVLGTADWLRASTTITVGSTDYTVNWQDTDGLATLSVGDRITVNAPGGLPAGHAFKFLLIWADGNAVGEAFWTVTLTKPVITFATPSTSGGTTTIPVAAVSQSAGRDNYRVNLRVNTTTGSAVALAPAGTASNVSVAGTTYAITWTDIGGEATVNAGDTFRITTAGGLPSASTFTFFLLWSDGSQIQSSSWTTA